MRHRHRLLPVANREGTGPNVASFEQSITIPRRDGMLLRKNSMVGYSVNHEKDAPRLTLSSGCAILPPSHYETVTSFHHIRCFSHQRLRPVREHASLCFHRHVRICRIGVVPVFLLQGVVA